MMSVVGHLIRTASFVDVGPTLVVKRGQSNNEQKGLIIGRWGKKKPKGRGALNRLRLRTLRGTKRIPVETR